jgi:Holliday junction DNA helicase RuvA
VYDYISGRLVVRKPTYCVVDANGVGFRLEIPLSTFEKLPRDGPVRLLAYLKVAEDDQKLFGFATEHERDLFLQLLQVSQLGPSKAVQILSGITVAELRRAIADGDAATLKRVRGIGDKLANRLIVELRGKLPEEAAGKDPEAASRTQDAVGALVALGWDRGAAETAVRRALKDVGAGAPVEDIIRRSFAHA